jgi:hypothetical protein
MGLVNQMVIPRRRIAQKVSINNIQPIVYTTSTHPSSHLYTHANSKWKTVLSLLKWEGKCVRKRVLMLKIFVTGSQNIYVRNRIVVPIRTVLNRVLPKVLYSQWSPRNTFSWGVDGLGEKMLPMRLMGVYKLHEMTFALSPSINFAKLFYISIPPAINVLNICNFLIFIL